MDIITNSAEQTQKWAEELAKKLMVNKSHQKQAVVIALIGDLGAGKTTFVQGFAKGVRIKEKVISPTFVLMRQHQIPDSPNWLLHLDLYRIDRVEDLKALDLKELFNSRGNIILIEWADKIASLLPPSAWILQFSHLGQLKRKISSNTELSK